MPEFLNIFFQKKNAAQIVSEKPALSKSLSLYIVSLAITLVGTTIGNFFEQGAIFLLGFQDLLTSLFNIATTFVLFIFLSIPGLIALVLLVLVYFIFAKFLSRQDVGFKQFLSDFLLKRKGFGFVASDFLEQIPLTIKKIS